MKKNIKNLELLTDIVDGKITAIGSTEDQDRVGDVLKVSDWDLSKFKKNPVLQAGHDYRPQYTIGVAKNIRVEGKRLIFEPVFHTFTQLARDIKDMFENKILSAWSVGFIPAKDEKSKNELLEVSAVAVPANAMALTEYKGFDMAKSCDEEESREIKKELNKWIKGCANCNQEALPKKEEDENEELNKEDLKKENEEIEKEEKKKEEKSPACRIDGETKKECMLRKIPEIMNEDSSIDQDQAIAMAYSICSKKCGAKEIDNEEIIVKEEETKKENIKENKKEKEIIIEEKEGRVLSKKNIEIIKSAIAAVNNTVVALENLLQMTEKPISVEDSRSQTPAKAKETADTIKVVKTKTVGEENQPEVVDILVRRILQKIAKNSNFALNRLNKHNK